MSEINEHTWFRLRWEGAYGGFEPIPEILPSADFSALPPDFEHVKPLMNRVCEAHREVDRVYAKAFEPSPGRKSEKKKKKRIARFLKQMSPVYADWLLAICKLEKVSETDPEAVGLMQDYRLEVKTRSDDIQRALLAKTTGLDIYEHPAPGDNWVGSWVLSTGSYGTAHLFVKMDDEHCNVIQRVVVKDCCYSGDLAWKAPHFWEIDSNGQRIPAEVKTMSALRGKYGSQYIVKILNWRIAKEKRAFRLYLEYDKLPDSAAEFPPSHAIECESCALQTPKTGAETIADSALWETFRT